MLETWSMSLSPDSTGVGVQPKLPSFGSSCFPMEGALPGPSDWARMTRWCLSSILPRKLLTHPRSSQGCWLPWIILWGMCTESRHRGRGFLKLPQRTLFISPLGCHQQLLWARVQEPAPPPPTCAAGSNVVTCLLCLVVLSQQDCSLSS